jgi:hypothetical protein
LHKKGLEGEFFSKNRRIYNCSFNAATFFFQKFYGNFFKLKNIFFLLLLLPMPAIGLFGHHAFTRFPVEIGFLFWLCHIFRQCIDDFIIALLMPQLFFFKNFMAIFLS